MKKVWSGWIIKLGTFDRREVNNFRKNLVVNVQQRNRTPILGLRHFISPRFLKVKRVKLPFIESGKESRRKHSLATRSKRGAKTSQNCKQNSTVRPSRPGERLKLRLLSALESSVKERGPHKNHAVPTKESTEYRLNNVPYKPHRMIKSSQKRREWKKAWACSISRRVKTLTSSEFKIEEIELREERSLSNWKKKKVRFSPL